MTSPLSEEEFELFRRLIREHVGISFSQKKKGILQRKLSSRLDQLGIASYDAYHHYLLHDKKGGLELRQLINSITVDQTAFFRHAKQFGHLANIILPQIATQKETSRKVRIWSAGCATGEEAYSIAMVVNEIFEEDSSWDVKILASDIDTDALKFAYKGVYPRHCVENVPSEYLNKHFTEQGHGEGRSYSVGEGLKKNMLFRRLNFMDPEFPFKSLVDVVFCRNVMIYFDQEIKKKLINSFFHILEQDGFMCLGASESLIGVDNRFTLVGHAIYQKTG
jgi:chemotaxis protein methyltransferase CheR